MDVHGPSAMELMEKLQAFMQRCETMLDENIEPDLTGMDEQVAELTTVIADLKFDQLAQIQPKLQELMEQLRDLEGKLKLQHQKIKENLQNTDAKKQAHTAYQKAQGGVIPSVARPEDGEGDA